MNAPFERCQALARRVGANGFLRLALRCARNIHGATDRRMPEAPALANWLSQSASTFGLAEAAVPDDEALHRARRRGVTVDDWRKVGMALEEAETYRRVGVRPEQAFHVPLKTHS